MTTAAGHVSGTELAITVMSILFVFVAGAWALGIGTVSLGTTDGGDGKTFPFVMFGSGVAAIGYGIWLGIDGNVFTTMFGGLS